MNKKKIISSIFALLLSVTLINAQKGKDFQITSPDGNIAVHVSTNEKLQWTVSHKGQQIIAPSALSLQIGDGSVLGDQAKVTSSKVENVNTVIQAINYKKLRIPDQY